MLEPFFLEIKKDGNILACREKKHHGVECEKINEMKELLDFILMNK